jgi:hypothetical protein
MADALLSGQRAANETRLKLRGASLAASEYPHPCAFADIAVFYSFASPS